MKNWLIGLGVVAIVAGGAAILWSKLGGGTDAIEAVPANAQAVAFFDVAEIHAVFTSERVAGLLGEIDPKLAAIDATLEETIGMSISNDVLPWVGGTAAVWMTGSEDAGAGCLVVSARDRGAADDFVASVLAIDGVPDATARTVDGGTVHDIDHEDGQRGSIGRVEGVVLFCGGDGAIDASVAALAGESMAGNTDVAALVGRGSLVVGWLDLPSLAEVAGEMDDASVGIDPAELSPAVTVFDVTDRGFEWALETPSSFGIEMADDSLASAMPAGTVLAFFGGTPDLDIPSLAGDVAPEAADFAALLGLLDGPMALGVVADSESILSQMFDAPLNFVVAISSSDPSALADEVISLVATSLSMTEDAFSEEAYAGGTLYTLAFPFLGDLAAMAVTDEYIAISATGQAAKGDGPRLVDSAPWQEAAAALSEGSAVSFFLDVEGLRSIDLAALLEMAESSLDDSVEVPEGAPSVADLLAVEQVRMVVAGAGSDGGVTRAELVVLIDW